MSIIQTISQFITPSSLAQISSMLGASQGSVEKAMGGAVPGVLSALMSAGKNPAALDALSKALHQQPPGLFDQLAGNIGKDPQGLADSGHGLLSSILGGGTLGVLATKLMEYAGLPKGSSGSLLGVVGSLVMATLGKEVHSRDLDVGGLLKLLLSQKDEVARAIPNDFAKSLQGTGMLDSISDKLSFADADIPRTDKALKNEPQRKSWLPWLIAAAVLAGLFLYLPGMVGEKNGREIPGSVVGSSADLTVAGVNLADSLQGVFGDLGSALASISDPESARASLPTLQSVQDRLTMIESSVGALSPEGQRALARMVNTSLPALRSSADVVLGDTTVAPVVRPLIDDILYRLSVLASG
ncbi:DUF937 domain-containing protein [Aestuariicella hydrocarbonica]|uniref:DUF937 domain-containing protein n=1 Tax=Pseudomaricurvus hydrocarbonicus TaxID=1470433 RepID=A0A9E5T4Q3_9GAMM|nr:DUF937 domain-containing protein [Aestuariicella hydrocarbonica]NHO68207.1 DUF937 domain-containing protein [Aestuariicella hydrocarbonica]